MSSNPKGLKDIELDQFKLLRIIGKGNVGFVWKVYNKKN